eukprot:15437255-Alexandrium_andersonii.AAC.1
MNWRPARGNARRKSSSGELPRGPTCVATRACAIMSWQTGRRTWGRMGRYRRSHGGGRARAGWWGRGKLGPWTSAGAVVLSCQRRR